MFNILGRMLHRPLQKTTNSVNYIIDYTDKNKQENTTLTMSDNKQFV